MEDRADFFEQQSAAATLAASVDIPGALTAPIDPAILRHELKAATRSIRYSFPIAGLRLPAGLPPED